MATTVPHVLHVVENLHRGAVESWLVRMFRYGRQKGLAPNWTFYCTLGREGIQDSKVRELGGRIVYSPFAIDERSRFIRALRRELKEGNYDILHCHHDLVSAVYLLASIGIPIRRRLVHVHNADENMLTPSRWKQVLLREPMRQTCLTLANRIVGISEHTLATFLHGAKRREDRDFVVYYGVEAPSFRVGATTRDGFRRGLDLPEGALLLLFAGRMVPEKNPVFAVDVLAELKRRCPCAAGVFVGKGSLEAAVRERVVELGLEASFRFLGWRADVGEIMAMCDWFILPRPEHPMEGLGLTVIEAQLAGLRLLLSLGIPDDPLLPKACAARLPLAAGAAAWADAAIELLERPAPNREGALAALADSPFDMDFALADLLALYA